MNELTFIAALKMLGFNIWDTRDKYMLLKKGMGDSWSHNKEWYINIAIFSVNKHSPFVEIKGSKISMTVYTDFVKAYDFITGQELK